MAYLAHKLKNLVRWLAAHADGADLQALIGLALVSYGVSLISVPWAFIVAGSILLFSGYGREMARFIAIARGPRKPK